MDRSMNRRKADHFVKKHDALKVLLAISMPWVVTVVGLHFLNSF